MSLLQQDGERCRDVECPCHGLFLYVYVHSLSNDEYDRGKSIYNLSASTLAWNWHSIPREGVFFGGKFTWCTKEVNCTWSVIIEMTPFKALICSIHVAMIRSFTWETIWIKRINGLTRFLRFKGPKFVTKEIYDVVFTFIGM